MKQLTCLHVRGETASQIGYGRFGIKLYAALAEAGVDLYNAVYSPNGPDHLATFNLPDTRVGQTNVIMWCSTPAHARGWFQGQHAVMSTMWEATRLPESFREHLHNFGTVIVPSRHNLELFSNYHDNVHFAPLGVDPAEWHYVERTPPHAQFRFLIGGSGPRKGTDLAFQAFRKVFQTWPKDGPVPTLVMKNPKGEDFYGDRVEMVTGRISDEAERDLYASCHAYLQPSRGEGFGLQPLQALAQGMPTVLTAAHGHDAFAHLGYSLSSTLVESGYFIYGDAGEWWEPDFDELCDHMRWIYDNYDQAQHEAAKSAATVADEFTWANTARRYIEILGDELDRPYSGDGSWFKPDIKMYPVVTNRDWRCNVAGASYMFQRGVTYYETSDVKRILFEAEVLDPACLEQGDEDSGLLAAEIARVGAYSASREFCPHCDQRLGSGVTRGDALLAQLEAEFDSAT